MPHIVTEKCVKCKYTDCVEICPVDCFFEDKEYLVIDPEICIDCGVCIPECPVEAIVNDETYIDKKSVEDILAAKDESELTQGQKNLRYMAKFNEAKSKELPNITEKKEELKDANLWSERDDKIRFIKNFEIESGDEDL